MPRTTKATSVGKPPARRAATGREPLADYQAKRDFTGTPEPRGRVARGRGPQRSFCVQKHLASHLHYDFRLEHHGVLLSWAVPKGPSPDPATKRLAMQVEDHPVDYGSFEGVIPSGYGAGVVSLWDRGMWEPLVDDVDAALVAGKLPFVLLGERLKGAWTLVRTGRAGPRSWLLMKQRDHWAHSGKEVEDPTVEEFATVLAREPANPWPGAAPVRGGETGALFRAVMERATVIAGEAWTGKAATGRRRQSAQR